MASSANLLNPVVHFCQFHLESIHGYGFGHRYEAGYAHKIQGKMTFFAVSTCVCVCACVCECVPSEMFVKEAKNQECNTDKDFCQKMYQIFDMGTFQMRIYSKFEAKKGSRADTQRWALPFLEHFFFSYPFCKAGKSLFTLPKRKGELGIENRLFSRPSA